MIGHRLRKKVTLERAMPLPASRKEQVIQQAAAWQAEGQAIHVVNSPTSGRERTKASSKAGNEVYS